MALRTVQVPPGMEPLFAQAEQVVSTYFAARSDRPERGTIELFGERYVLVRAASLSVEFFSLVERLYGAGRLDEAGEFARNILFDLAHAIGQADARNFHAKMDLKDPIARLSAGPIHFAHSGWARVDIKPESVPSPEQSRFCLVYDHPASFESDAWIHAEKRSRFPVCIMNAGYSSGWCEESFGLELVACEILCRARGDEQCRFVMAHPAHLERLVQEHLASAPQLAQAARGYQIPDFFARKRLEEDLRRATEELEERVQQRTAALSAANEALRREMEQRVKVEKQLHQKQKMEAVGRLAGGIAHDFNNLMTLVIVQSSMLLEQLHHGHPMRDDLEEILHAGERAAALSRQLLTFSRGQLVRRAPVDLCGVVQEMQQMLRRVITAAVDFVVRLPAQPVWVEADKAQLEQVILNLSVNARDAMPQGGTLTLEVVRILRPGEETPGGLSPQGFVALSVSDTGVGLDEEQQLHIFEPFFASKSGTRSNGLGLSTVYAIVQQSGGEVEVRSTPGQGSSFRVLLPMVAPPGKAEAPGGARAPGRPGARLLLVEDQDDLRALLHRSLEQRGFVVESFAGATQALARVAAPGTEPFDALVTDVVMPELGGRELAERLRERLPTLPVLFVSGYAPDALLVPLLAKPGFAFLHKPFLPAQLAARLQGLLHGDHG